MLKLKLKHILLAQGKQNPQAWLQKNCNMTMSKAHNILNHKQKSISYADLSELCDVLRCSPDELFWWEDTKKKRLDEWHPAKAKLTPPDKDANWGKRVEGLNPERVEAVIKFIKTQEEEKMAEAVKKFEEVKQKEREQKEKEEKEKEQIAQKEEEQDKDAATPLD